MCLVSHSLFMRHEDLALSPHSPFRSYTTSALTPSPHLDCPIQLQPSLLVAPTNSECPPTSSLSQTQKKKRKESPHVSLHDAWSCHHHARKLMLVPQKEEKKPKTRTQYLKPSKAAVMSMWWQSNYPHNPLPPPKKMILSLPFFNQWPPLSLS